MLQTVTYVTVCFLLSFVMLQNEVRINQPRICKVKNSNLKIVFYVYKSVCSKEPGERFTHIIKTPFCLKRRRKPTI